MVRYLSWLCLVDDRLARQYIFIISGTRENFANELKDRVGELFEKNYSDVNIESKYGELVLNKTTFKTFPTKSLKAMRGYTDVAYIFIDEADMFDPSQQIEIGSVIRSYEEKSNAKIIMVSTPNRPDGMFYKIEYNEEFKGFFKKMQLLYERGLDKIFNRKKIEKIKKDNPSFEKEYNGKYLGNIGDVLTPEMVDYAVELGKYIPSDTNPNRHHFVGIDPGFGSSKTGIVVCEWDPERQLICVISAEQYPGRHPTTSEIIDTPSKAADRVHEIYRELEGNTRIYVDGSASYFIRELKVRFDEPLDYDLKDFNQNEYIVNPINFATEHKQMLQVLHGVISSKSLAIPEESKDLIIALRTAKATDWNLDKKESVNNDLLDALRLSLKGVQLVEDS